MRPLLPRELVVKIPNTSKDRKRFREKFKLCIDDKIKVIQNPNEIWGKTLVQFAGISPADNYSYLTENPGLFTHKKLKTFKSLEAYYY